MSRYRRRSFENLSRVCTEHLEQYRQRGDLPDFIGSATFILNLLRTSLVITGDLTDNNLAPFHRSTGFLEVPRQIEDEWRMYELALTNCTRCGIFYAIV